MRTYLTALILLIPFVVLGQRKQSSGIAISGYGNPIHFKKVDTLTIDDYGMKVVVKIKGHTKIYRYKNGQSLTIDTLKVYNQQ